MRSSNSGLAHGTNGSPQSTIESVEYAAKVAENEKKLKERVKKPLIDEGLVEELKENKVKFSRKDMVFITKDATGQVVWLESGNAGSGLQHICNRHTSDFANKVNVQEAGIPEYLHRVITYGEVVEDKVVVRRGRKGYSRKYRYNGEDYILTGIGLNGYLVSAYPVD